MPVGDLGRARRDALVAELAREVFRGHLPVAVHEDAQRLAHVVFEDQRLDDGVFVHAEVFRGSMGAATGLPRVQMRGELDLVLAKHAHRHRHRIVRRHDLRS
jgi:hypothetical protein